MESDAPDQKAPSAAAAPADKPREAADARLVVGVVLVAAAAGLVLLALYLARR